MYMDTGVIPAIRLGDQRYENPLSGSVIVLESYQCDLSVVSMIESHHPHKTQPWVDISPKMAVGSLPPMPCSTTAVQEAVNFKVTGSNPVGAV